MHKIFTLLISLFAIAGFAQEMKPAKNPEAVKAAFVAVNQSIQTFASPFKQSKKLSFMNKPLISNGEFYYQKSDRLRWEYLEPIQYVMLINGEQVRIKEDGKVKSYSSAVNEIFKTVKEVILGCISGDILENPDYEASYFENENAYQVKLKPIKKDLQGFMKEVNIFIDIKEKRFSHLVLMDGSGDLTTIEFTKPMVNQELPKGIFDAL
ncbi:LolA family protein [Owenweeksia hongkongensis]|uniref:LolA family protein n=1 Tax=Owenweeksia hongkongensis TaxID=253245 RepID=UPI003A8E0AE4